MNATVVYEIARYKGKAADAELRERLQLVAEDGALRLRDGDDNETPCEGTDIASVIGSNPALHKVLKRSQARITCSEDISAQLPVLLEPTSEGGSLLVHDRVWDGVSDG